MAKAGRGQTRRDSKRRVLRPGESVRADGKYQYKYHIDALDVATRLVNIVGDFYSIAALGISGSCLFTLLVNL